ncbi:MAG: peptide cleavage/export ABC transporter [Lactobacillaceae bacterium]|nr:peptide cleavage/export ABC transporter [Lactobacillaceae bacterium]
MEFGERHKITYIAQVDERDCGVAALSMVLHRYGSSVSLAHLREIAKTDLVGTTALGIKKAAEDLGFTAKPIKADMSLFGIANLPLPFIAHVNKEGKFQHYYVVYGFNRHKKQVYVADPDINVGKTRMSFERFEREWTGVTLFIAPSPEYKPTEDSRAQFFTYMPVILRQRKIVANVVIAALMVTLISIAGSYYLQAMMDQFIPNAMRNTLGIISVGLIVTYLIQQILSYAKSYLLAVLGQRLAIDIILSYIKHIFELPMSFFATRRTGEIVSRFSDANSIIDALAGTALSLFLDVGIMLIVGTFLVIQNTRLFLLSLVAVPLYVVVVYVFMRPLSKSNNAQMQSGTIVYSSIIESINGIETIKSLTSEQTNYQKIDGEFVDMLKKSFSTQRLVALQDAIKGGIRLVLNVLVLWSGSIIVINNQISIGQLITFNALLGFFTDPLQNIINLQTVLQKASVANNRLNEVYLVGSEFEGDSERHAIIEDQTSRLEIRHVDYKYGFGKNVIDDVSVKIPVGQKVAIVGVSGSGKSTLMKLLVNFYQPTNYGQIFLGNHDIQKISKQALRQQVTYLPQEPYIFSGSIMDNLLFGVKGEVSEEDILEALTIAGIKDEIEQMEAGLATELTDGSGVSGGQKQRIALARALLVNAPILILDESTSNLDVLTERTVIDNLLALPDKTIIFVAHRLSIPKRVDRVIVMSSGKIVEDGNHDELLADDGYYSRLVNG